MKIFGTEIKIFSPAEEVKQERDERRRERETEREQKRGQRELARKLRQREQERVEIEDEIAKAAEDENLPEAGEVAEAETEQPPSAAVAEPETSSPVVADNFMAEQPPQAAQPPAAAPEPAVALKNAVVRFAEKPPVKAPAKPAAPKPKVAAPAQAPLPPTPPTPSEAELAIKEGRGIYTLVGRLIQTKDFSTYPHLINTIMASIDRIQTTSPDHPLLGPLYNIAGGLGLGYVASQPNLNKAEKTEILFKSVTRMFSGLRQICQHAKLLNDFGGGLMQNLSRFGEAIVKLVPDMPASCLTAKQWWLLGSSVFERYKGEGRGKIAQALYAKAVEAKRLGMTKNASL